MRVSTLERYLAHKRLVDSGVNSPVAQVKAVGKKRIVRFKDGTMQTYTKRALMNRFNSTLQTHQTRLAYKSVRTMSDGTATAMIGGKVKGVKKKYVSVSAARAAIARRYPKAAKQNFYVVK